jgi:uncharacterized Fe-S cluster-containing protein
MVDKKSTTAHIHGTIDQAEEAINLLDIVEANALLEEDYDEYSVVSQIDIRDSSTTIHFTVMLTYI